MILSNAKGALRLTRNSVRRMFATKKRAALDETKS